MIRWWRLQVCLHALSSARGARIRCMQDVNCRQVVVVSCCWWQWCYSSTWLCCALVVEASVVEDIQLLVKGGT
jgi:hypothetical protein